MLPTRRHFLRSASATAAGFLILPGWARAGTSRNDRIHLGVIGTGKQAMGLARRTLGMPEHRIVAACDVNGAKLDAFVNGVEQGYADLGEAGGSSVRAYRDYHQLLDHPELDAVLIATPDHQHAAMCVAALERGLRVYCEKPLAHTVEEGRAIVRATETSGKVLQTGSMQRSMRRFQRAVEIVRSGALGDLREVLVSIGPPPRPFDLPARDVPASLDWAAWLGPSVRRPFHPDLAPASAQDGWAQWRAFAEYGGGMVTDWGAHMFDIVQWATGHDTGGPTQFFPPGGANPEQGLTIFYADGLRVEHRRFGRGNAVRFVGSEGSLDVARGFIDTSIPGLVRPEDDRHYDVHTNVLHFRDFYDAIRNGGPVICPAETGHRTSSVCTLANIAYRLRRPLVWDPATERITNDRAANRLLGDAYRTSLA